MNILDKKIPIWFSCCITIILCVLCIFFCRLEKHSKQIQSNNIAHEMKFTTTDTLNDNGADKHDRNFDHKNSPYFYSPDFYNMKSTDTKFILPHFKTMNQTSWWSCGQTCILMVLEYYGLRENWNEKSLTKLCDDHSKEHIGTCLFQMIEMLKLSTNEKLELISTYDIKDVDKMNTPHFFLEQLKNGFPVIIGWNDWGGHWEVIIGYDTMGTQTYEDDVLIITDPYDTSDHNQDGYGILSAARFINNFSFYNFFPENHTNDKCFIVVKPK